MIPLDKTPLYSANSYPNRYFDRPRNTTEWNIFMGELVAAGNELQRLKLQVLAPSLRGAHLGEFKSLRMFMILSSREFQGYLTLMRSFRT